MKHQRNITILFSAIFIVLLLVPNIVMLFGLDNDVKSNTAINFKTVPSFKGKSPLKFIGDFKNYYIEQHGLKKNHINNYVSFKRDVLNDNPIPNRALKGKNDWYFLGNFYNNAFNNSYGNASLLEDELQRITKDITETQDYLSKKGIAFYIVIPPNKHSIYTEHLPFSLHQNKTRMDVLNDYLNTHTDFKILDLRKNLLSKKDKQLFIKTDTHWNAYGAFIGYDAVMNTIKETFDIDKRLLSEYQIVESEIENRDLTRMVNLNSKAFNLELHPKFQLTRHVITSRDNRIHIKNDGKPLKVLMYRDSFAEAWMDFFDETFGEVIYLRGYSVKPSDIEKEKPDIVIIEVIERNLNLIGK